MNLKQLSATGAIAGFVVVGGMQLAGAQESTDDSTTTTTVEESTTPDREGCDHDGAGVPDDAPANATEPSPEA